MIRPMTRQEMRPCAMCGKGLMHDGNPMVYRIVIEQHVLDLPAIQRQAGLEQHIGSPGIAAIMSPITEYTKPVQVYANAFVCQDCAMDKVGAFMSNTEDSEVPA